MRIYLFLIALILITLPFTQSYRVVDEEDVASYNEEYTPQESEDALLELSKRPKQQSRFSRAREKMDPEQSDFQDSFGHINKRRNELRQRAKEADEARRLEAQADQAESEASEAENENAERDANERAVRRQNKNSKSTRAGAGTGINARLPKRNQNGKLFRSVPDRLKHLEDLRLRLRRELLARGTPSTLPQQNTLMEIESEALPFSPDFDSLHPMEDEQVYVHKVPTLDEEDEE